MPTLTQPSLCYEAQYEPLAGILSTVRIADGTYYQVASKWLDPRQLRGEDSCELALDE
jgi:hypothetical protein